MRAQNPAVVQTTVRISPLLNANNITLIFIQEQYEFIHQVIVVLTGRYETYANFTVL